MDYLKVSGCAMAQRDPLVEYQREGYDMFMAMLLTAGMKEESVGFPTNVTVEAVPARRLPRLPNPQSLPNSPPRPQLPRSNAARSMVARERAPCITRQG